LEIGEKTGKSKKEAKLCNKYQTKIIFERKKTEISRRILKSSLSGVEKHATSSVHFFEVFDG